ncbi:hypothetical protein CVT24_005992 [Panaeolus cyanescens]|uniref:BZIP domain-containing protein n=1 Tax=Panaeolus cyanescens TaxID=181874 RepID=A0A409V8W4_9AGAR|nr:hypothetical protein CVT24_005992 [Panaeolus cyanescens]
MSTTIPLSIPLSQILSSEALLSPLSPVGTMGPEHSWDLPPPPEFNYGYYTLPPSPPPSEGSANTDSPSPAERMLKIRMTPDNNNAECVSTHQLFDFADAAAPPTPPSRSPSLTIDTSGALHHYSAPDSTTSEVVQSQSMSVGSKRSASPTSAVPKKRAPGERISSKDFIPPDVSGLSKREARLVKNRAAAFLSRQRKREEFECMEIRVAELEQENARLLALTQNGSSNTALQPPTTDHQLLSEVEQLKAQLAAARERELSLSAQLASTARDVQVKMEEPQFSLSSPPRSTALPSANKSGASLGLMVLLCALPTLLSMRSIQSTTAPTSFAIPNPFPTSASSAFDYNSFMPNDYDWSRASSGSMMDMDIDSNRHQRPSRIQKLEFADAPDLGDLDISFDASPSDDGKIRVRILPSSSSSSSTSRPSSSSSHQAPFDSRSQWSSGSDSDRSAQHSPLGSTFPSTASSDPFLGIPSSGSSHDFGMAFSPDGSIMYNSASMSAMSSLNYGQLSTDAEALFGNMGSEYQVPDNSAAGGRRRVRIALKSMPQAGGEGGEWEVQIC